MDETNGTARRRPPRLFRWIFLAYAVLLLASHAVRWAQPAPTLAEIDHVRVPAQGHGAAEVEEPVRVAYIERPQDLPADPTATPVVLIHGSPGSRHDFAGLAPALGARRAVFPDMPGFAASSQQPHLPDYSVEAHARYTLALMDELEIERAHLVGFSMGGGVVLEMYDEAPDRVASVTLLSAVGVQELELFGHHRLNHAVHGAQLVAFDLLTEGFPHFGLFDGTLFTRAYARNFYDTDQRPLRAILKRFRPPMLILHGREDFLVPAAAALEHHRIVPHSELQMFDQGHFMVFDGHAPDLGRRLEAFLATVDSGEALTRDEAHMARRVAAERKFDPSIVPAYAGVALVLIIVLIALGTMVTEDLTCIAVGLMISQGRMSFLVGLAACAGGIFFGDLLLYAAGRMVGRPALERVPLRWMIRPEHVKLASRWFDRRGAVVIGLSRFTPGMRLPTYFAAGMLRANFFLFTLYFGIAVAVWTPLLVGGAMLVGNNAVDYLDMFQRHVPLALLLLAATILLGAKVVIPSMSHRGRRRLVGAWRRWVRWEFWSPWFFYPPVAAWVVGLGLRYRSPFLFTVVNPAIEDGGVIDERKGAILDALAGAGDLVARTRWVPAGADGGERQVAVREAMTALDLDFPVVLKPDRGQRGSGVKVIRDEAQLERYLAGAKFDLLVQEYVSGDEFGIFYYRRPDEPTGHVFSVTEKRMPVVIGDGERTVDQLIHDDERAVCVADIYRARQADRLDEVLEPGERLQLVELGTHARGAIFLDGSHVLTPDLERAIDRISRTFEGFYFGRYDIRVFDHEAFARGEGFKVIELNGVTSEATHIYDPKYSVVEAYRVLFEQWRLAFEIGAANRARGARPTSLTGLLRRIGSYRKSMRSHPS